MEEAFFSKVSGIIARLENEGLTETARTLRHTTMDLMRGELCRPLSRPEGLQAKLDSSLPSLNHRDSKMCQVKTRT